MEEQDSQISDAFFRGISTLFHPNVWKCMQDVQELANVDIDQNQAGAFLRFHAFITEPQPKYIAAWRQDQFLEKKWYHVHVNGVLGDVRGALAAAHYHADRLNEIVDDVMRVIVAADLQSHLGASTIGLGGTRKMDIEYQAFILAYRRSLDYLSGALAAYFKIEANSFRKLPKSLAKSNFPDVAEAISSAHGRHVCNLEFVLAEGKKSVRNRIAHYDFVSAGCVNITPEGVFIAGGGENLDVGPGGERLTLKQIVDNKIQKLHDCIDDVIDSFVSAAKVKDAEV